MIFTDAEARYLGEQALGRLATIGPTGAPQSHPVTFWMNGDTGTAGAGARGTTSGCRRDGHRR
jgi:pyridoxamine 5'-phosphate oxidase family protein